MQRVELLKNGAVVATTNAISNAGAYSFSGLAPGHATDVYTVQVVLSAGGVSAGYTFTGADTVSALGSDVVAVPVAGTGVTAPFRLVDFEGTTAATVGDAGLVTPKATIGGQMWTDVNGDGTNNGIERLVLSAVAAGSSGDKLRVRLFLVADGSGAAPAGLDLSSFVVSGGSGGSGLLAVTEVTGDGSASGGVYTFANVAAADDQDYRYRVVFELPTLRYGWTGYQAFASGASINSDANFLAGGAPATQAGAVYAPSGGPTGISVTAGNGNVGGGNGGLLPCSRPLGDNDLCTVDSCSLLTGEESFSARLACPDNDGNVCTQTDTCQGGICVGSNPVVCTASDQCHLFATTMQLFLTQPL